MAFVGMTPDQVDSAANGLRGQAQELQAIKTRVQNLVTEASAHWDGNDIKTFRTVWNNTYKPRITSAIDRLNSMAAELSKQATQQRTTSGDSPGKGQTTPMPPSATRPRFAGPGGTTSSETSEFPSKWSWNGGGEGPRDFSYDKAGHRVDLGMTKEGEHYSWVGTAGYDHGNYISKKSTQATLYGHPTYDDSGNVIGWRADTHPVYDDSGNVIGQEADWTGWKDKPEGEQPNQVNPEDAPNHGVGLPDMGSTVEIAQFGQIEATYGGEGGVEGSKTFDNGVMVQGDASYWWGVHGEASAGMTVEDGQLTVGGSAMAGFGGHAEASGMIDVAGVQAHGSAEATAGGWASADASVSVGSDGIHAKAGGEAMIGASASASASIGLAGAQVGVTGTAYAGLGVKANVDVEFSANQIDISFDLGVALGVGAGVKFDISISPADIAVRIKDMWPF